MNQVIYRPEWLEKILKQRVEQIRYKPEELYIWWWKPCKVNLLIMTDGFLDYSDADFGLSTFVTALVNDGRSYVKFNITLAHRSSANMGSGISGITERIQNFSFNNPSHFTPTKYDVVMLFGADTGIPGNPNRDFGANYLSDAELRKIAEFMNNGGGVFATGDHGALGMGLCSAIARVRSMRLWDNASGKVGMSDSMRNDTNRRGNDASSTFDDQSDDIPQEISPRMYSSRLHWFWKETYPHPLLCAPTGVIKVLPDHAHEGECIIPNDFTLNDILGTPEYPGGIHPEIIATSTVLNNSNAGGLKANTISHRFGAISAYDGHLAGVGRVSTDATWHHFVNVNLIGEITTDTDGNRATEHASVKEGFAFSAAGLAHFEKIKHYYVNIPVWLSRQAQHTCFNSHIIWETLYKHRVLEASMDSPHIPYDKIPVQVLFTIGTHAKDVIGKQAGHCRTLKIIFDLIYERYKEFVFELDPWRPFTLKELLENNSSLPHINTQMITSIALGSAILALKDEFGIEAVKTDKLKSEQVMKIATKGAHRGMETAIKDLMVQSKNFSAMVK